MKKLLGLFVVLAISALVPAAASRAQSLSTRWASDVDPMKPLPEYPRPQLVRKNWLNLNGQW